MTNITRISMIRTSCCTKATDPLDRDLEVVQKRNQLEMIMEHHPAGRNTKRSSVVMKDGPGQDQDQVDEVFNFFFILMLLRTSHLHK